MPLTVACPSCPAKLKVPEAAAGRRVKCPKCGGVMTVPAAPADPTPAAAVAPPPVPVAPRPVPVAPPPPPVETPADLDFSDPPTPPARAARRAEPADEPARPARRRDDDSDERPAPRASKPTVVAKRRRDDDNDYRPDDYRNDAPEGLLPRLHRGWKMVALGYRMLGLAMLFALLGILAAGGAVAFLAVSGKDLSLAITPGAEGTRGDLLALPMLAGGFFAGLAGLFAILGYLFFLWMPKDEDGGKGKTLGIVMFIFLFIPGLSALVPWLLPLYSAGVGNALDKPKLRKYGIGLYIWYAVGFILTPALAAGAAFAGRMINPPEGRDVTSTGTVVGMLAAGVIMLIMGLVVFFSIWGTFAGLRRGIQASIRERGIIDGEDPQPAEKPPGKKGRRDDDDDRPAKGKGKGKDRDSSGEHRPVKAAKAVREPESDEPRPSKRKRDDDSDDDLPRPKGRRDDDDSDDGSRRRR